jgi:AmpD protein
MMQHWLHNLPRWQTPNHNARPCDAVVDTVVLHNISLPPEGFSPRWVRRLFNNDLATPRRVQAQRYAITHPYFATVVGLQVSAHFYISRRGRVLQCVPLHRRAWHAGKSQMPTPQGLRDNLNHTSVGIELAGSDTQAFTGAQYAALRRLLLRLNTVLPLRYITGHSDIAPLRKTDPGPMFDWAYLQASLPSSVVQQWVFRP